MFVLTIDRRASRQDRDGLDMRAERDRLQRDLPRPVLDWDVNAGDELQALYDHAAAALAAVLALAATEQWHVGLGVGAVDEPLAGTVRESTGPAFVAAREAVNAAKEQDAPAVRGNEWAERAGAVLGLVCAVRGRRSPAGHEAAALAESGLTQHAVAERLGIGQSSVSRRLSAALWHEEREARDSIRALLQLADGYGPDCTTAAAAAGAAGAPGAAGASGDARDVAEQLPQTSARHTTGRQTP